MIGPVVNSGALALGGVLGAVFGGWIPERLKTTLPLIFGIIVLGMGSTLTVKTAHMHVVVLALIVGSALGELIRAESFLERVLRRVMRFSRRKGGEVDQAFILQYITLVSAMCFGSMGIFGALSEGVTGNPEILYTKAVLDLFTGIIFGASMGAQVSLIALPQFIVLAGLYCSAGAILPLVSPEMLDDFSGCGGIIFLATGLRMCGIKVFPVVNMVPSLLLVLPLSWLWTAWLGG